MKPPSATLSRRFKGPKTTEEDADTRTHGARMCAQLPRHIKSVDLIFCMLQAPAVPNNAMGEHIHTHTHVGLAAVSEKETCIAVNRRQPIANLNARCKWKVVWCLLAMISNHRNELNLMRLVHDIDDTLICSVRAKCNSTFSHLASVVRRVFYFDRRKINNSVLHNRFRRCARFVMQRWCVAGFISTDVQNIENWANGVPIEGEYCISP